MKKTYLVAGGAGFIGTNLVRILLSKGHRVICVDNFDTGKPRNIETFLSNPDFSFIYHNIVEPLNVIEEVDCVINLACPASPPAYQENPVYTIMTCVLGTKNLLDLAVKKNARFLQASTSEVYGDPIESTQSESYRGNVNTVGPRSCYDEGKRVAESLVYEYRNKTIVNIIRIFNTYGPFMDPNDGRVISNFINQALSGENITIYGDGNQTRSFTYVSDLVEGLLKVTELNEYVGPINLGNPDGHMTIDKLAHTILNIVGYRSTLIYKDLPVDDPTQRRPDITKAKELLDWEPVITVEEGLRYTIDYYKLIRK